MCRGSIASPIIAVEEQQRKPLCLDSDGAEFRKTILR
jgi:hypothetical protein